MERQALYDDRFQLYLDLIDTMRPFWPRLA
jgi:hypothetical protein